MSKIQTLRAKVEPATRIKIEAIATRRGETISVVLRAAIREFLGRHRWEARKLNE